MVGFQFRIFMYLDSVQIKDNNWSQASTKCPWKVLAKSKTKHLVPVQPSGRAFEGVQTPSSVLHINIEDVWTSEQHRPDARSFSIQQGVWFQKSTLFGKSLQAVQTTWQHVRTMSSSSEYSRVPFLKGYRRKPSRRGKLLSGRSLARVWISTDFEVSWSL